MPKKPTKTKSASSLSAHIAGAGEVEGQPITAAIETNFMPYAMSVILSRAIPQIDGFKPSHRKLLYTMYKMGLLTGARTKSANIVGATMKLNPHGDMAIYDTLVRLSRGFQSLLNPYVDSKGNFGKTYSSDMEYAASRYTEAKLDAIAAELFADIDKNTVDFVDNYDATMKEPALLPVRFPSILANNNIGIAVGMASSICSYNLKELCDTTIALMRDEKHDILSTLPAPDFPGGGQIVYDREEFEKIAETGRGSVKVRAVYSVDQAQHCIDITQIPPTTTVEAIIAKITELVKNNKVREISDVRNEIGLDGLKITVDLKRGADADKLMARLYALTPLQDAFPCNFNVLIGGAPKVMGVRELLTRWIEFRMGCVHRRVAFDLSKAQDKRHLLKGLAKILLDIDKAVRIVRESETETEVVPNLMIGFGIDQIQAEFVAEIRLRHLNREYILSRTGELNKLDEDIARMEGILKSNAKILGIIVEELNAISKTYGRPRQSAIVYATDIVEAEEEHQDVPDYPCTLFYTAGGYFKKITPQSLRMSAEQKLKEGDTLTQTMETTNSAELLFFGSKGNVYKATAADFADTKASVMGDYIPTKLGFDEGETAVYMAPVGDYSGRMVFFFENGKAAKVELSAYETKQNRRKLINAYSVKSPLAGMFCIDGDKEFLLKASSGKCLLVHTGAVAVKATRDTIGVQAMTIKAGHRVTEAVPYEDGMLLKPDRYRARNLPAAGAAVTGEQMKLEVRS